MTKNEKQGLEEMYGRIEVIAEYCDNQNIFDFVEFDTIDEDGDRTRVCFCLSDWSEVENPDFSKLVQKSKLAS